MFEVSHQARNKMVHVLIATPTAGGIVKSLYATTLAKAVITMKDVGWDVDFLFVDGSYISRARNYFVHALLSEPKFTHLVMIDSDMSVEGHTICRMIRCDKPVVAAAYSQRRMDMEAFAHSVPSLEFTLTDRAALALEYNIRPQPEPGTRQVKVTDGMCRVHHVALGCSAIRRDAFENLITNGIVRVRPDRFLQKRGFEGPFYNFFDEIVLEDGDILSEDYSFCKRWLSMPGNEIWALVEESIGHVGDMVYGAPYLNRLLQGKA
jgi:hypothetical protein